jgi:hypothetical protein
MNGGSVGSGEPPPPLVLDVPGPPDGLSYEDYEDYRYREICRLNGLDENADALIGALQHEQYTLQAAAAHTLGSLGMREGIAALDAASHVGQDVVEPEIGYALTRLGQDERGRDILYRCLDQPIDAFVAPSLAAGYLAQLGDFRGAGTIEAALGADNLIVRMVAAKQLYFFIPFARSEGGRAGGPDVWGWFRRALDDPETDVHWQAVVELGSSEDDAVRTLLADYVANGRDPSVRAQAARLLDSRQNYS